MEHSTSIKTRIIRKRMPGVHFLNKIFHGKEKYDPTDRGHPCLLIFMTSKRTRTRNFLATEIRRHEYPLITMYSYDIVEKCEKF